MHCTSNLPNMTRALYVKRSTGTFKPRLVPTGLLLLAVVPVLGGSIRLVELASGPVVTEANARFVTAPVPAVLHIVSATVFTTVGAFQFVPQSRRGLSRRHRLLGRVLLPSGVVCALSGLWMTLTYPWPTGDGLALYLLRLLFGSTMVIALGTSAVALRRCDYTAHARWMTRGYAIGAGAGTQALLLLPVTIAQGAPTELLRASLMGAGWVINILIAELVNHRRSSRRAERSRRTTASAQHALSV